MARPTISLQAAIGPGTALTNPFIIGQSLIGGTDVIAGREIVGQGSWQELADRCYTVSTRRGRQRLLEQYRAGTLAATLDNTDGALDPAWTDGPYTDSGVSRVRAMAGVNLSATWAGVEYPIIATFADSWKPELGYPEGGRVSVTATDAFKIFTKIDYLEQPLVGSGDLTGARIHRILDLADWSINLRDIDPGNATHQATNLAQPVASQLRLTADSERGDLYIAGTGKVTLRERLHRSTNAQSVNVQWTIGDGAGEVNPSSFDVTNDDDLIYNDIRVARAGGTMVTRQDPAVVPYPYLWSTYTRTDLTLADDIQVAAYADEVLRVSKDIRYRVSSVTFRPDGYDEIWPMILGARFGDRVTVSTTTVGVPLLDLDDNILRDDNDEVLLSDDRVWSADYFVEGIDHDIPVLESGGAWQTVFHLADATKYPTNPFIIGTSLIGGTDVII